MLLDYNHKKNIMKDMKFAILNENLTPFLREVKSLVSKDTYVQQTDFEDALIPCRKFGATPSGMIVVEIKGQSEDIDKVISILHKYDS
jgi:hypothetical protein